MKYKATITETLMRVTEIEADSVEEAERKIRELYSNGEIVLTADDCINELTDFTVKMLRNGGGVAK